MRSSDGNSITQEVAEDHSTDLLTNLKDNIFSLVSRNTTIRTNEIISNSGKYNELFNERLIHKNNHEIRCQSLPDCVEKCDVSEISNKKTCPEENYNDESFQNVLASESWFKTWPERCDKQRSSESSPLNSPVVTPTKNVNTQNSFNCNEKENNLTNKLTLNEALKNISLAYSPVTKQLHLLDDSKVRNDHIHNCKTELKKNYENGRSAGNATSTEVLKKLGHRRTEAGSFSSTISTISEPSSTGSLLSTDDQSLSSFEIPNSKARKKSFSSFLSKHVFPWKASTVETNTSSLWKLFSKQNCDVDGASPVHVVASSSALIQHERPSNLPAKTLEEEQRHRNEYQAIIAAAKKRDAETTAAKLKQQKLQLKLEEKQAASTKHFQQHVLPNWETMRLNKRTLELWWQGLPSSVRGKVWRLAIGNELNLTPQLYEICLCRAQSRLNSPEPPKCDSDVDKESSMDVIQLDISRTFPNLCIFQEGGPYSETLHSLLASYVCYRPDVGYVQGMSYIAAILILNMEQYDAFICFANLLNQPLHLSAFTLNQVHMQAYYNAYNQIFNYNLPKLFLHFERSGLTPDLYLLDWIYTIFAKAMPLDIACRVWDVFFRDGYEFIFRTALGILHLNQDVLMDMDFINGAQFLTRLPDDMSSDQLFRSIQLVSTTIGKRTFSQIFEKCLFSLTETYRDLA